MAETVVARWIVRAGREAEAAAALRALSADSLSEEGCIGSLAHQDADDPRRFLLYEQFVDADAVAAHRRSAHYRHYVEEGLVPVSESWAQERYVLLVP